MSHYRCKTLTNSSDHHDMPRIRFALLKDCKYSPIDILLFVIESLKMPYTLTFHDKYGLEIDGKWTDLIGEVVDNRSDIGAAFFVITDKRHNVVDFSPLLGYGSLVSILSGRIYANTGNEFNIFDCFSTELWIVFGLSLIIVAIFEEILHFRTKYSFLTLIITIFNNMYTFMMIFLNQNSKRISCICCISHLLLYSSTLLSIFLMTLFFNSQLLSNILYNPLLNIDSFDDLAQFLSTHPDVSLISDNDTFTWKLMKVWPDQQAQNLFEKMKSVSKNEWNYEQVYRGKSIIIAFDDKMEFMLNKNPFLKFHISNDRHFVTQYGYIYSKLLNPEIKQIIDKTIRSVYETGLQSHWLLKMYSKRLHISDIEVSNESISLEYFRRLLNIFQYVYIYILMLIFLFTEIIFKMSI